MRTAIILVMVRRTVTIPDQLDERVREAAHEGESFSAAVARLLEDGLEGRHVPSYVGMVSGPGDNASLRVEEILDAIADELHEEETYRP
jgi:hypothetical protein